MNVEPQDEILSRRWAQFAMLGVALASDATLTAQTLCISEQTE